MNIKFGIKKWFNTFLEMINIQRTSNPTIINIEHFSKSWSRYNVAESPLFQNRFYSFTIIKIILC